MYLCLCLGVRLSVSVCIFVKHPIGGCSRLYVYVCEAMVRSVCVRMCLCVHVSL